MAASSEDFQNEPANRKMLDEVRQNVAELAEALCEAAGKNNTSLLESCLEASASLCDKVNQGEVSAL